MKRFILTTITLLILISDLQGQWEILNQGLTGRLNAIDFVNERIGWSGGGNGVLLKTEDGGQTWFSLQQNEHWSIRLIDFLDESLGWAAVNDTTNKGIILKTSDGGQTWTIQKDFFDNSISSIIVVDERIVYALVNSNSSVISNIIKTIDDGASWEFILPNNENRYFHSIRFVNSDTGFVAGTFYRTIDEDTYEDALILKTENGGKTWTEKTSTRLQTISDLQFVNDSTGFFKSGDLFYKTEDAFKTWPIHPLIDSTGIAYFYALNQDTIYAITQFINWPGWYPVLIKSTNGGRTWKQISSINMSVGKIYFCSPQIGFLICSRLQYSPNGESIFRSTDSGVHWESQLLSYPFHDVHFLNKDKGFACGGVFHIHYSAGNIFVTNNGGKSWELIANEGEVTTCFFVNDKVGFASINLGDFDAKECYIFKTEDGGKNWMKENDFGSFNSDINFFFVNENTGWAVGRTGWTLSDSSAQSSYVAEILMTVDQGENWQLVWRNENYSTLNSIYFTNADIGWAVGDNGLVLKSTDGNQWVEIPKITDLPLKEVFFIDKDNGYIVGGYLNGNDFQAVLFKTNDGGDTWKIVPDIPYLISDIYFHDPQHGWAIGCNESGNGVIVETRDGGDHWSVQVDSLIGSLKALSYRDGYLWAVGDYGLVLRTDLTTIVEDLQEQHLPSTIQLFQNYPNPFNPKTVISYQLAVFSEVELSVYNLLGQKIATLVSEKQPAKSYSVVWDATGFSAGIYFCQMEVGKFKKVIKLALVK